MGGATGVLELAAQPGLTLFEQSQGIGPSTRITAGGSPGVVQKLDEGGGDQFRSPPPLLMLERMPLAISELEAAMQGDRQLQGLRRPGGTPGRCG